MDIKSLIDPEGGIVDRRIFADREIYELERERLFARCWLYLGHECEIPNPGDFVTRYMGEEPVILCRDSSGKLRAHLNMCRHRGNRVCRADRGNAIAEAELTAGEHYAVVDTYDGEAQAGPFVLHLEAIGDAWIERPIAEGVTWRARRYLDLAGGGQIVHALARQLGAALTVESDAGTVFTVTVPRPAASSGAG